MRLHDLAKMIDHSLLHPTMTDEQIAAGCDLARRYDVATVCVKPYAIGLAREMLGGSDVGVCSVVAFPHGNSTTAIKVAETEDALAAGATEIDMVVNVGKVLGGDWDYVREEIRAINQAVTSQGGDAQGHLRERLPRRAAHHRAVPDLLAGAGGVREDLDRLRVRAAGGWHVLLQGGDRCAPETHAGACGRLACRSRRPAACGRWTTCCGCGTWA